MPGSKRQVGNVTGPFVHAWCDDMAGMLQAAPVAFNLSLAYSVGANALTIAAKQQGGSNCTATSMAIVGMRSSTAGSGDYNVRSIEAALSLVVSSGSTLGQANSDTRWTYVYLIDNAGTLELAVSSKFFGMQGIVSTTAEGGAGAADSATVMYSTTARSNVSFVCVGRFKAPQTAAGTWAAAPTSAETGNFQTEDFPNGISFGGTTFSIYVESSYTATLTGCSTSPTYTVKYTKAGNIVVFQVPPTTGTSNAGTKSLTGAPAAIQPATQQRLGGLTAIDNGGAAAFSAFYVETSGVMNMYFGPEAAWTSSGTFTTRAFSGAYQLA